MAHSLFSEIRFALVVLIIHFFTLPLPSWASSEGAESHNFTVNFLYGASTYLVGKNESDLGWELAAAHKLLDGLEAGLQFGRAGDTQIIALDCNYFFMHHLFLGIQIGSKSTEHESYFYYGPQGGYDFPLGHGLTLGPEFQMMGSMQEQSITFEALGSLKYSF